MSAQMIYAPVLNGVPVTLAGLPRLAMLNAGHFTATQICAENGLHTRQRPNTR